MHLGGATLGAEATRAPGTLTKPLPPYLLAFDNYTFLNHASSDATVGATVRMCAVGVAA
jgi:hypothetical protein